MPDIARPFLLHPLFFQNFLTLESAYQPEITFDILIRITLNLYINLNITDIFDWIFLLRNMVCISFYSDLYVAK